MNYEEYSDSRAMFGYEDLWEGRENRPRTCEDLSIKDFKEWEALYRWDRFMSVIEQELDRRNRKREVLRERIASVCKILGSAVLMTAAALGIAHFFLT